MDNKIKHFIVYIISVISFIFGPLITIINLFNEKHYSFLGLSFSIIFIFTILYLIFIFIKKYKNLKNENQLINEKLNKLKAEFLEKENLISKSRKEIQTYEIIEKKFASYKRAFKSLEEFLENFSITINNNELSNLINTKLKDINRKLRKDLEDL